jgi:hypothetical protein
MSSLTGFSDFASRLRDFMRASAGAGLDILEAAPRQHREQVSVHSDAEFNRQALELFALQFSANAPYHRLCEARNARPGALTNWEQIPAMPTSAFKEFDVSCIPPAGRVLAFHSSGTTERRPSRHFHGDDSLPLYDASLWPWFAKHLLPDGPQPMNLLCLTPPPMEARQSSLVHMFETVRRRLGSPGSAFLGTIGDAAEWTFDCQVALAALEKAVASRKPVLLLGTAFLFVHLLDSLAGRGAQLRLPPGSRALETGGYKGRSRTMPRQELHSLISRRLGISASHIVCEYGMSELSSQAYDRTAGPARATLNAPGSFHFPPWARAQIISAETGKEVSEGETGLIRIFDLANAYSVLAVQTEDLGARRGDGFELIGRAAVAEPRGCSLMSA